MPVRAAGECGCGDGTPDNIERPNLIEFLVSSVESFVFDCGLIAIQISWPTKTLHGQPRPRHSPVALLTWLGPAQVTGGAPTGGDDTLQDGRGGSTGDVIPLNCPSVDVECHNNRDGEIIFYSPHNGPYTSPSAPTKWGRVISLIGWACPVSDHRFRELCSWGIVRGGHWDQHW